jgi:hypothetical protein
LREGWAVARELGYRFGGSLHVMHDEAFWINFYQFKLFESVIEDVLSICPDAWYLQLANPVLAGVTLLGRKYPEAKVVGLCHGYRAVYYLASVLGLDERGIEFTAPGLNHFIWLTEFKYEGGGRVPHPRPVDRGESCRALEQVPAQRRSRPEGCRPVQEVRRLPPRGHVHAGRRLVAVVVPR